MHHVSYKAAYLLRTVHQHLSHPNCYCIYVQVYDPDMAPLEINVGEIVQLLAKEEELVAARTKAENLQRENVDMATELAKKVISNFQAYFKTCNITIYPVLRQLLT